MTERFRAIVNPAAGGGRCGRRFERLRERLETRLERVVCTEEPHQGRRLAAEAVRQGVRHLLAVGGDGTALEVADGALGELEPGESWVLSVLPLGTGNSLVRHFTPRGRSPRETALDGLLQDRRTPLDVMAVDHVESAGPATTYCLSSVTFGLPTRVADFVNRHLKPLGVAGYSISVVLELLRLRNETFDGRSTPEGPVPRLSWMLCVQNTVTVGGGMRIAPAADPSDGRLDLVWGEPAPRPSLIAAFPRIFSGTHVTHPAFRHARIERLDFEVARPVKVMLDGEVRALAVESIRVVPSALQLAL